MKYWKYSQLIINWQHTFGRHKLPWQIYNNSYYTWISEIMLQQTRVTTVVPYFIKFIKEFKNIKEISNSTIDKILYLWSGLGYYSRAKNIYKTSKIVMKKYNGHLPNDINSLIKLPGIGKTTAGAILSLSHNYSFSILDSNVKRILIRFYNIDINIKNTILQKKLWNIIEYITPIHHAKQFNQSMMDLGAMICTPKNPNCNICPIQKYCQYTISGIPIKKQKYKKKTIYFLIIRNNQKILLENRITQKIWNKLFCFPEFNNIYQIKQWLYKNNLSDVILKKYKSINYNCSNLNLKINFFKINITKIRYTFKKKHAIWYNFKNIPCVGIPSPIKNILSNLKVQ